MTPPNDIPYPPLNEIPIKECGEPLIEIPSTLLQDHRYFTQGWDTDPVMRLRPGIIERLSIIDRDLRAHDLALIIFNAHRRLDVQVRMRADFFQQLSEQFPVEDEVAIWKRVDRYAAPGVLNPTQPSPHMTGAAIDLGLFDLKRSALVDMGTPFDALSPLSTPGAFEQDETEYGKQVHANRHILFQAMASQEFTVQAFEWWHYVYGTNAWARDSKVQPPLAIYGLIGQD